MCFRSIRLTTTVGSKDPTNASLDNILSTNTESLSSNERRRYEDLMKQQDDEALRQRARMHEEAKEKFLSHFTIDRHQKIINQGEIKLDPLLPLLQNNNVSNSNDNQSIKHYIDQQRN